MNIAQAKNAAWIEAHYHKQDMFVVQRGQQYFAASTSDMQKQFAGLAPVFTIKAPK